MRNLAESCKPAGRYLPQELLNDKLDHLDKADMFALGISIYELASGTTLPTGQ